jgi:hypothetical protein
VRRRRQDGSGGGGIGVGGASAVVIIPGAAAHTAATARGSPGDIDQTGALCAGAHVFRVGGDVGVDVIETTEVAPYGARRARRAQARR